MAFSLYDKTIMTLNDLVHWIGVVATVAIIAVVVMMLVSLLRK